MRPSKGFDIVKSSGEPLGNSIHDTSGKPKKGVIQAPKEVKKMLKLALRYTRYALASLGTIGFITMTRPFN